MQVSDNEVIKFLNKPPLRADKIVMMSPRLIINKINNDNNNVLCKVLFINIYKIK